MKKLFPVILKSNCSPIFVFSKKCIISGLQQNLIEFWFPGLERLRLWATSECAQWPCACSPNKRRKVAYTRECALAFCTAGVCAPLGKSCNQLQRFPLFTSQECREWKFWIFASSKCALWDCVHSQGAHHEIILTLQQLSISKVQALYDVENLKGTTNEISHGSQPTVHQSISLPFGISRWKKIILSPSWTLSKTVYRYIIQKRLRICF